MIMVASYRKIEVYFAHIVGGALILVTKSNSRKFLLINVVDAEAHFIILKTSIHFHSAVA